jgi:hypothetical protein
MNVTEMELDANGEKPKFNEEGKEMLYFEKEDEEKFWDLIQTVKKARGDVTVLIEEIGKIDSIQALVKMHTWFSNFAVRLSQVIEKDTQLSDSISTDDFPGFIDHLIFLGKEHVAKVILSNGEELKNKANPLYWDQASIRPWQFYIWDKQTKKRHYWVEIVPREIEMRKKIN